MKRQLTAIALTSMLVLISLPPAAAQAGASEASGQILDSAGNPVAGARITFSPRREPDRTYNGKTNKKGKYYLQGLWTPQEDKLWVMVVEAEGFQPMHVRIESRSVNKVLLGPIMEQPLKPGTAIPEFPIAKMGHAKVDLTLVTAEEAERLAQEAFDAALESGEIEAPEVQQPQKDPWLEATMMANAGEYELSLPLFVEAIEENPEDVIRHETYAKILAHLGQHAQALAEIDAALALEPDRLECRLVQSQVYIKMGDLEHAREVLDAAQAIAPDDMRIYEQRVYVAQEGGDVAEQVAVHQKVVQVRPEHLESWLALGDLYAKTGDLDASAEAYAKVVAIDPDNAYRTYYNIAVLILNRDQRTDDDTKRAVDALRRAVEINPDYGPAWHELGVALLGTGDMAGAVTALESYLKVSPDAPDAAELRSLVASLKK
jgi:tetratricopeptide (TPR) repeat protein